MGRIFGHLPAVASFSVVVCTTIIAGLGSGQAAEYSDLSGDLEIAAVANSAQRSFSVTDLRVGKHPDKTRIVLDISKPTNFAYEVSGDGRAVFIDLPTVDWNVAPFSARHAKGVVIDYRFNSDGKSSSRLSVLTDRPVRIKRPFFVAPRGNMGHRIVIDLIPGAVPPASYAALPTANGKGVELAQLTRNSGMNRPQRNGTMVASLNTPHIGGNDRNNQEVTQNRFPQNQYPPTTLPRHLPQQNRMIPQQNRQRNSMSAQDRNELFGIENTYLRFSASLSMLSETTNTGSGNENTVEYQPGFGLGGAYGIDMQNRFRLEGELLYTSNSLQKISGTGAGNSVITQAVGGDTSSLAFMANVAYDFPNQTRLTPYLMGGFGLAGIFVNEWEANSNAVADDTDWVLAFQAGAGIGYDLDDRTDLELSYRYFETQAPEFGDNRTTPFESEFAGHNIMLGVRLKY